jgi:predicted transcriptional regulator
MYRTHVRIIADILNITYSAEGTNVTNIVRKANISYNRLKDILNILTERGLLNIEEIDGSNRYIISDKGREFMKVYSRFYDMAESFGLKI